MPNRESWLKKLGIQTINKNLIETALTHSSYKGMGHKGEDNERLEFLGDAVLDLINANLLYSDFTLSEAHMTEIRKTYVSNNELSKIFNKIGIGEYIRTAKNLKLSNKIKADFIEALFGAVFIANGYTKCLKFWRVIQNNGKNGTKPPAKKKNQAVMKNAKSTLAEFCKEKSFLDPEYVLLKKQGLDHNPVFTARVHVKAGGNTNRFRSIFKLSTNQKSRIFADGNGKKIKLAEMRAAQNLCKRIGLSFSK